MKLSEVRTPLAKARNWGSAHDGVSHFFWQRITALALIPLSLWFVWSLLHLATGVNRVEVIRWMSSGVHASALILLLLASFHHAKLGLQVVIEDYVGKPAWKYLWLLSNLFLMYGMAAVSVLAVLKLHLYVIK